MRLIRYPGNRRRRSRGQALVEFALVIPLFLAVFTAVTEFSFLFTTYVSIGFASKDAVQVAATLGDTPNADTAILERIYNDVMIPADPRRIDHVDIYRVDITSTSGSPLGSQITTYNYQAGSFPFTRPDNSTVSLPFVQQVDGYPVANRCNVNKGAGCIPLLSKTTVDTIGVRIYYQYLWITPFPQFVTSGPTGPMLSSITTMRLEPVS